MDRWTIATVAVVLAILITGLACYEVSEIQTGWKPQENPTWSGDGIKIKLRCVNPRVKFGNTLMCVATVKLTEPNVTRTIKVTEVLLDGRPVWPRNIDGRKASTNPYVVTPVIKLKPTNVYEDTTITMTLNDNFEVYYFGHDYLRKAICGELRRGTHLITVVFDNNASVSGTFEIKG